MEISDLFDKFKAVLDKLIMLSGGNDQTKANLIDATYLNFVANIAEEPTVKPLLTNKIESPLTMGEFENKAKEFQSMMQKPDFDFTEKFQEAIKQTLNAYVSKLEASLNPEKITELKKIISEEL